MKKYKILTEASGCLTSNYLIKAIKESGNAVCGSDINDFNYAKYQCDDFIVFPKADKLSLSELENELIKHNIDVVIPSLDETLLDWSANKNYFFNKGIQVIVSPKETIEIFQDKWNTYNFFKEINVPTPKTSLSAEFPIIKPRNGRGSVGIYKQDFKTLVNMEGNISQEEIKGEEYTVDTFFDKDGIPVYIIPRKRLNVKNGKSTQGQVCYNLDIDNYIKYISTKIKFIGPINFQLFIDNNNKIFFIEVNPRIAGGMALAFYASENWINLIIENLIKNKQIFPKKVNYGAKMMRYYAEIFV